MQPVTCEELRTYEVRNKKEQWRDEKDRKTNRVPVKPGTRAKL